MTTNSRRYWNASAYSSQSRPAERSPTPGVPPSTSAPYALILLWGLSCGAGYFVAQEFLDRKNKRTRHGFLLGDQRRGPSRTLRNSSSYDSLLSMGAVVQWRDLLQQSIRRGLSKLRQALVNHPPPWWLLLTSTFPFCNCSNALTQIQSFFWYPLALWWTLCSVEDGQGGENGNSHSKGGASRTVTALPQEEEPVHSTNASLNEEDQRNDLSKAFPLQQQRYLELLVHNVSHTDMVLSVEAPTSASTIEEDADSEDEYCMCQPRFSAFDMYARRILESLQDSTGTSSSSSIVSFPRYERAGDTRFSIVTPKAPSRRTQVPTGIQLPYEHAALEIIPDELSSLRFRGKDAPRMTDPNAMTTTTYMNYVFFPLLATLLPRWHQRMQDTHATNNRHHVKKVLLLVTGVGTPRNWTHSITGNSTELCAQIMEKFVAMVYPDVTVVRIHSDTNLFRYDENILFVNRELMPCIDAYRDAHARGLPYPDESEKSASQIFTKTDHPFSTNWKQSFSVTLSFADGSPARTHAIQASLRPYRPTYFHVWQLKTFWHDTKIVDDDIEVHSFEEMETVPAMETSEVTDVGVQMVVEEMKQFRQNFLETILEDRNDIRRFWLRKTMKPVLAVLLVNDTNGKPVLYRGTNMEVSMPTGSLCAERNVIGSALAMNPGLKREDLRMVAVLAVPLPSDTSNVEESVVRDPNMSRSDSVHSFSSIVQDTSHEEEEWILAQEATTTGEERVASLVTAARNAISAKELPIGAPPLHRKPSISSPPGTPMRCTPISLYSQNSETNLRALDSNSKTSRKQKRTVLLNHGMNDLNPLMPCGSCNEWLKKIAESNPYFKVVTFTDAECTGIFINPCQE